MAIYVWKAGDGTIKSFGETPFEVITPDTQEMLDLSMQIYSNRFRLVADKTVIEADGEDEANITLYSNTGLASMDVDIDGVIINVLLNDGVGILPPISSEVADSILIQPANKTQFCVAGEGSILISSIKD